jgi:hypothetical protein
MDVSEPRPSLAYCSSPGWMWAWEPWWWWWCRLGITPDSFTRALWESYQQRHLERIGGMDEGMRISRIEYLWYINMCSTCRKILRLGTSGFTSHPNGFLSPLKIHRFGRVWTCGSSGKDTNHYTIAATDVLTDSIVLMMKVVSTSETSVRFYQTTRCNIPEDSHLHSSLLQIQLTYLDIT